jgi:hypothetical protein
MAVKIACSSRIVSSTGRKSETISTLVAASRAVSKMK